MDVIIIGVYNNADFEFIQNLAKLHELKIEKHYEKYNIGAETGIRELKKYYNLLSIGILIEKKFIEGDTFYSYPIINEITEYFKSLESETSYSQYPKLFSFFEGIRMGNIQKLVIAFADEWSENTTVKVEEIKLQNLNERLTSFYVWCYGYRNLRTNSESRDDFHPLVLDVDCQ